MCLLRPLLVLLLEYLAFSDASASFWKVESPPILYAWEGACVQIPCSYSIPGSGKSLTQLIVYQNYSYDKTQREFRGSILYNSTVLPGSTELSPHSGKVRFLGNTRNDCTLLINSVKAQDTSNLGLRMLTEGDMWMHHLHLNISERAPPPHIQLPPEIQELQEVTLICSLNFACSEYPIQLQWSLKESGGTSTFLSTNTVSSQSKLTFTALWSHHGSNLTCSLRDQAQQLLSEKMVQLNVKHKPKLKIEVSPQDAIVTEGQSVTMTCEVISSNPKHHTLSWFKNGESLGKQGFTLTLSTATRDMSGKYQCEAINDLGPGRSEEVDLQVHYAPEPSKVEIQPSAPKEGNAVILNCQSQANPPPTNYTWYHNGLEMSGVADTFQIPSVGLRHAGKYSCLAENSLGRGQVGQEAELDVQYPPKLVTLMIKDPAQIREGDNVTLSCHYNSSNPGVNQYQWKLGASQRESHSQVLTIQRVAWNEGPVTCAACNQWCSWAGLVNLDVQHAPRDVSIKSNSSSEVRSGQPVFLSCDFSSSRPTDVHFFWKKNGILLKKEKQLRFNSITPEDAGSYHCLVNNSIGQTLSEAWELRVLYAPRRLRVSISPQDGVVEGKEAILTCESDANPPVSHYDWFHWNDHKPQQSKQMLRLDSASIQDAGAYWCQGVNWLGKGQSPPSILTVYYSPETIGKRTIMGVGLCLVVAILVMWGVKLQRRCKRIQSQQGLQENSSGQSFFVRNQKVRRTPCDEGRHSLGCYNPVMEDAISYAMLRFPDTQRTGNTGASESQGPSPAWEDTVTYSVVQRHPVAKAQGDYENVTPDTPEEEGIHYSELIHFGTGERSPALESVEYVTLKH
ncbi:B-cell receptor CD22 [Talpa occidentalis]|uniref:B-cell receptor CD22 n=1 Tax=Talpa occidentalis TaxID=50954 RepID=UPI00188F9605|nr:B-cell receptor CD22 [Talpa occidentalis]